MKNSIICNETEVCGLLDGSVTELYLPLKPQPIDVLPMKIHGKWVTLDTRNPSHGRVISAPYKVGQVIKVRETWVSDPPQDDTWDYYLFNDGAQENFSALPERFKNKNYVIYRALWTGPDIRWHSAATMPLWASRLSLLVLDVRVEKSDLWKFVVKVEVVK